MKLRWPLFEFLGTFGTKVEPPPAISERQRARFITPPPIAEAQAAWRKQDLKTWNKYGKESMAIRREALLDLMCAHVPTEPPIELEPKMAENVVAIKVKITDMPQFAGVVEALGPWLAEWRTTNGTSPARVNLAKAIIALEKVTEDDDVRPVEAAQDEGPRDRDSFAAQVRDLMRGHGETP